MVYVTHSKIRTYLARCLYQLAIFLFIANKLKYTASISYANTANEDHVYVVYP